MVKRIHSDSVLALGKKLVGELGQEVDTPARWMAHYIAEKMEEAKCRDAILKLWAHRSSLPNGQRPFEDFEPIFRVLQSLDLDDPTPRYFRQVMSAVDQDDEDDSAKQWLRAACGLDYTARILIRYCLVLAAREAVDKSRDWVELAEAIVEKDDGDIRTVRFIADDTDTLNAENPDDSERVKIEDLLKKLEGFTNSADLLSSHLRQQLGRAKPSTTPE